MLELRPPPEATGCSLIGPTDPPPVEVLRPDSTRPVILLADHAGVAVPQSLNDLGLSETDRRRHFAWDIGIEPLTKRLSAQLGATAVLTHYSRLLIDPNRELDDPTSIPVIGEDCVIEGNRGLTAADRQNRANNFFHPYHDAVTEAIDAKCRGDDVPVILSLHSFTPMFKGQRRPWHIGVLWNDDGRLPLPLMAELAEDRDLIVGDNQPYSGRNAHGYTMHRHADRRGLANALIEVRNDLISTEQDAFSWADRLAPVLERVLQSDNLAKPMA